MGGYDGAETCELVGAYILNSITLKHGKSFGLYRDDGLGVSDKTPREIENIKKDICKIFSENGLKITIKANKKNYQLLRHTRAHVHIYINLIVTQKEVTIYKNTMTGFTVGLLNRITTLLF